ncbi:MAG: hypothetical protein AAF653_16710 [Chloroflexota bacterium]
MKLKHQLILLLVLTLVAGVIFLLSSVQVPTNSRRDASFVAYPQAEPVDTVVDRVGVTEIYWTADDIGTVSDHDFFNDCRLYESEQATGYEKVTCAVSEASEDEWQDILFWRHEWCCYPIDPVDVSQFTLQIIDVETSPQTTVYLGDEIGTVAGSYLREHYLKDDRNSGTFITLRYKVLHFPP